MNMIKNTKFDFACIRLTVFYVLIAMAISISFSVAIFDISSHEIGRGLGRQSGILQDLMVNSGRPSPFDDIERSRRNLVNESNAKLRNNLIYFNFLIFVLSALSSYVLARKTLDPIAKAVESQNRFTADASHELRTPLTAMKTEIEVAMRDKKFDFNQAKNLLSSNLEEIGKLESLSNALLSLTRYKEQSVPFSPVNLEEIIIDAYQKIESLAKKKGIVFKNHLENITVSGDGQSLRELFVILLDNAVKYSHSKSVVSIKMSEDKKHVYASIKDQGVGIRAHDVPRIFERFFRADLSRSREKAEGNGLGLAIAESIAKAHHAKINVESTPGHGSVFTVAFPKFHEIPK